MEREEVNEEKEVDEEECGCGCHRTHGGHHGWYGHHRQRGFGFPLMSIEEEVKTLEEMKEALEKRLEIVNKRIEVLKR